MRFIIKGKIKPYVRMTQRGKFVKKDAQEYLAWKDKAGYQLKQQAQAVTNPALDMLPLFVRGIPLSVYIYLLVDGGLHYCDIDNCAKAILDAAQGIIFEDDRWVDVLIIERVTDDKHEAIVDVAPIT